MDQLLSKLFNKQPRFELKWRIITPIIILCIISLILLKSTSNETTFMVSTFNRQLVWLLLGAVIFICSQFIRIQFFYEYAYLLYAVLILSIIATYYMPEIGGSRRWIMLGTISFQPSELGKLIMVFVIAKFLADQRENFNHVVVYLITIILAVIPAVLVFKQPDLGTAFIYLAITYPMLYWSGVRPYYLFIFLSPLLSVIAAFNLVSFYVWMLILVILLFSSQPRFWEGVTVFVFNVSCGLLAPYIWTNILYEHQRNRILTLIDPLRDPQGRQLGLVEYGEKVSEKEHRLIYDIYLFGIQTSLYLSLVKNWVYLG